MRVFQIVGATAFIAYSLALCELSIWYRRSWSLTLKGWLDGLIYALLTAGTLDRKSTRLNSSHGYISYAVFCLKKKKTNRAHQLAESSLHLRVALVCVTV